MLLQWHSPTSSLFASTECDYIDRLGGRFNYGAMEGVRWPRCAHKPSDFLHRWMLLAARSYGVAVTWHAVECRVGREACRGAAHARCAALCRRLAPAACGGVSKAVAQHMAPPRLRATCSTLGNSLHPFGTCSWDAGEHLLVCYAFKEAPDKDVLPLEPEHDSEWEEWTSSDEETEPAEAEQKAARHRARKAWRPRNQPGWW